jgi:hypothetical protein
VSEFLLLGMRPAVPAEVSPARAAGALAGLAVWHGWLRRWGLLRSYAVQPPWLAGPRVLLLVRASGPAAARRLAAGWEQAGGYQVTVVPMRDGAIGEGRHGER